MLKDTLTYLKKYPLLLLIIIPAWILTLLPIFFDGQPGCVRDTCGYIMGSNFGDGSWFKAVAATSFKTFPFQMPNYAGETLKGYHYLPNLVTYLLSVVGIPIDFTIHKIIPLVYLALGTTIFITLARKIKDNPLFVGIFIFFMFFGMHLSLFTSLYHLGYIKNGALINTFQATRILESPHVSLALLGLFYGIIRLYKQKQNLTDYLTYAVLLFLMFGTKFYVAFSFGLILGIHALLQLAKTKDYKPFMIQLLLYGIASMSAIFLFYDPLNTTSSGSIFIFSPFATVNHIIETKDLFYNENLVLARYFLESNGWSPRLIFIQIYSSILFILFYFGTRAFGLLYFFQLKELKMLKPIEVAIGTSIFISFIMSIMFVQKGDWFNPIQFAVPAAYLTVVFLAKLLYELLLKNKLIGLIIITLLVTATFPANMVNAFYLNSPARVVLPQSEIEALRFLKDQPDGIVFFPIQEHSDINYIPIFTGKITYLNHLNTISNAGIDYTNRLEKVNEGINPKETGISYYYLPKTTLGKYGKKYCEANSLSIIYENEAIIICKYENI